MSSLLSGNNSALRAILIYFLFAQAQPVAATRNVIQIFGYLPNKTDALIAAIFYFVFGALLSIHIVRRKNWWGLCLPIGCLGSGLGFITRIILAQPVHQTSKPIMIVEEVFTLCFPAGFLAFNYIVYGRLVMDCIGARHSLIRPQWVSTFFILSDVSTFVIQGAGAAFLVQPDHHDLGEKIVETGVIMQTASFGIYAIMLALTYLSVRREGMTSGAEVWWRAYQAVAFSSTFIVIRSIYRMISSIERSKSSLSTNELYLYILDVIPLLIAIVVYIVFWPGNYMTGEDSVVNMGVRGRMQSIKLASMDGAGSSERLRNAV